VAAGWFSLSDDQDLAKILSHSLQSLEDKGERVMLQYFLTRGWWWCWGDQQDGFVGFQINLY
jgi:hypothetical protein